MENKLFSIRVYKRDCRVKDLICKAVVMATSKEEAIKKFENDPFCYGYDNFNYRVVVSECDTDVWTYR